MGSILLKVAKEIGRIKQNDLGSTIPKSPKSVQKLHLQEFKGEGVQLVSAREQGTDQRSPFSRQILLDIYKTVRQSDAMTAC